MSRFPVTGGTHYGPAVQRGDDDVGVVGRPPGRPEIRAQSERGHLIVDDSGTPGPDAPGADRPGPAVENPAAVRGLLDEVLGDPYALEDRLDACDAYVVLVADPDTGALDSYGPFDGTTALLEASRRRHDLDDGDLGDVAVTVVRHHSPV